MVLVTNSTRLGFGEPLCDAQIRSELGARLHRRYCGNPKIRVIHELGILQGQARVDLAVINGSIHGYEIKSERDTLDRLPSQVAAFSRVLDYATIITAPEHLDGVTRIVPSWWGIQVVRRQGNRLRLAHVQKKSRNPMRDSEALVQLLWRDEALAVLQQLGLSQGYNSKPRRLIWKRLTDALPPTKLATVVRLRLLERDDWRPAASYSPS
ncbi:MAG: sce7726 family protein [Deltaproteobacteria bacterium]|nr:sce7726 family protein [Deltaproteobacteria bacterium]